MKKTYIGPITEVIKLTAEEQIMAVSSDKGIGYGGVDEEGTYDPASRELDFLWEK